MVDSQRGQDSFALLDDRMSKNVKALLTNHRNPLLLGKYMIGNHFALRLPGMQADQAER
jgi:hypothetical protein